MLIDFCLESLFKRFYIFVSNFCAEMTPVTVLEELKHMSVSFCLYNGFDVIAML